MQAKKQYLHPHVENEGVDEGSVVGRAAWLHFGGGQQETLLEGYEKGLGLSCLQKLVHFRYEVVFSQNQMHL